MAIRPNSSWLSLLRDAFGRIHHRTDDKQVDSHRLHLPYLLYSVGHLKPRSHQEFCGAEGNTGIALLYFNCLLLELESCFLIEPEVYMCWFIGRLCSVDLVNSLIYSHRNILLVCNFNDLAQCQDQNLKQVLADSSLSLCSFSSTLFFWSVRILL